MSYLENKIWSDLIPSSSHQLWIASVVLGIPDELIEVHRKDLVNLIWRVYFGLGRSENDYVTKFNAARCDLIADTIRTTDGDDRIIPIAYEPEGDISYWLASHVLRFTDQELAALCDISIEDVDDPGRALIPVVKSCYRKLRKIKLDDPVLQNWHRSRHLLIRYFLDAVYHELSA
jgi:hypothetical protein